MRAYTATGTLLYPAVEYGNVEIMSASATLLSILYIGNHPRKKSFANYLLHHSLQENFRDSGNHIYKNSGQDKKLQEKIHECFQIREIREPFLSQTIPNIRY